MSELKERWHYQAPLPQGKVDEGQLILRDGTTAELRPVRPGDEGRVRELLEHVSAESRRHRFHGNVDIETATRELAHPGDSSEGQALLVLKSIRGEPRAIAHGGFRRLDETTAEVAFLVHDDYQGKGLGTLLLERLALLAARQGIDCFQGPTEAGNVRMREVFQSSGFAVDERERDGVVSATFSISPSEESVAQAELRERIATVASLQGFMKPRSVALIGASRNPGSISYRILHNLVLSRFNGPVYPVNPKASVVGSIPAYPDVSAIPGPVDLAVIAVPAAGVLDVVDECGEKGVRGLLIISAGFAETGQEGAELQDQVVSRARRYGMRILGPNCLGLITTDPDVRLNASFAPHYPERGPVAMASQSGALGLAVLDYTRELGLGLSSFVSLGNKADISSNDLIQYWEDDEDTSVILLYLESFGNPRRFARLARRVGRTKPIVVVKAGRSAAGSRAASSHTAALAASESATEALFHQAGIIRAETLDEMFNVATLFADQPLPQGPRTAIVTNAGGPGILAVDALAAEGLDSPETNEALREQLRDILPPAAAVGNPVDMIASANAQDYKATLDAILADDSYDSVMVIYTPIGLEDIDKVGRAVHDAVVEARQRGVTKTVLTCFMGQEPEGLKSEAERVPNYRFPEGAARALGSAYRYKVWKDSEVGRIPLFDDIAEEPAREVIERVRDRGGGWLDASEVRTVLQSFGLQMLPEHLAASKEEAVEAAEEMGFPVVVKLASTTIVHKSEWDGVQLNLQNAGQVRAACERIESRLDAAGRREELDGFLVQKMAPEGPELVIGVAPDPLFGPLVAFGLGGTQVEVLRDVVFRITPLTDRDAHEMVRGIRAFKLLTGFRGAPPADLEALEEALLRISRLVEAFPQVSELDLNPVRGLEPGEGAVVLDARIKVDGNGGE